MTRWSKLPLPVSSDDPRWRESWEWLYRRYAKAMGRYVGDLLRRFGGGGHPLQEAPDLVDAYLAAAMEKGWLSRQGQEIRIFRAYLQDQLRKYVISHLRKQSAQKRGGGRTHQAEGLEEIPDRHDQAAGEAFERGWIDVALARALDELRRQNPRYYEIIVDLLREKNGGRPSADLGARLGLSQEQLAAPRCRARKRIALLIAQELRQTVADDEAFEEEFALLVRYVPWLEDDR